MKGLTHLTPLPSQLKITTVLKWLCGSCMNTLKNNVFLLIHLYK